MNPDLKFIEPLQDVAQVGLAHGDVLAFNGHQIVFQRLDAVDVDDEGAVNAHEAAAGKFLLYGLHGAVHDEFVLARHNVHYVEALGDYVHIVTGQHKLIVYSTMKAVEEKFPSSHFVRIHRSFIVNVNRIQALEDNLMTVEGKHIPVGQTYLREVLQRLNKF